MDYKEVLATLDRQGEMLKECLAMLKSVQERLESAERALEPFSKHANNSHWWDTGGVHHDDLRAARAHMEKYHGR